jgi:hypothetical protein
LGVCSNISSPLGMSADILDSITVREGEARESWRAVDQHEVETIKRTPVAQWGFGASRLIETAEKVVKVSSHLTLAMSRSGTRTPHPPFFQQFGLYDRPKLDSWHKGRVVLLGDAAHPTPPVCHPSRVTFPHESGTSHTIDSILAKART